MLTKNSEVTKNNILSASKKLFWNNGYTNVSVRKIAEEAKCDIALISRYFQNKKGLFVVLLNKEFDDLKECLQLPKDEMVNGFVDGFIDSMDLKDEITFTRMLVMNGSDPEVGSLVRDKLQKKFHTPHSITFALGIFFIFYKFIRILTVCKSVSLSN